MIFLGLMLLSSQLPEPVQDYCTSGDSGQPYTLCLAEWYFEQSDNRLNDQWEKSFTAVMARKGQTAANRLRTEQRRWIKNRDRECDAVVANSPVTQQGRNGLSCMSLKTDERTLYLKNLVGRK